MLKFLFLFLFLISVGCTGGPPVSTYELEQALDAEGCSDEVRDSYLNSIRQLQGQMSNRDIEDKVRGLIDLLRKYGC